MNDFNRGILTALSVLNLAHNKPDLCAGTISELGLGGTDCSDLPETDKESLRKINEGLPGHKKLRGLE